MKNNIFKITSRLFLSAAMFVCALTTGYADDGDNENQTNNEITEETGAPSDEEQMPEADAFSEYLLVKGESDEFAVREEDAVIGQYEDAYLLGFAGDESLSQAEEYYRGLTGYVSKDAVLTEEDDEAADAEEPVLSDVVVSFDTLKEAAEALEAEDGTDEQSDGKLKIVFIGRLAEEENINYHSFAKTPEESTEMAENSSIISNFSKANVENEIYYLNVFDKKANTTVSNVFQSLLYAQKLKADCVVIPFDVKPFIENDILRLMVNKLAEEKTKVIFPAGDDNEELTVDEEKPFDAILIGANNYSGEKTEASNYGELVTDYAIAENTKEAAVIFAESLVKPDEPAVSVSENDDNAEGEDGEGSAQEPTATKPKLSLNNAKRGGGTGVTEIENLSVQLISGADLETYEDQPAYIWTANHNKKGHRFTFRVSYATSGIDKTPAGELQIRIPQSILVNREGHPADVFEIAVPAQNDVDASDRTNEYAYMIDGGDIVIFNRLDISAAVNGYFEISYVTDRASFNYEDMGESEPFNAYMTVNGLDKQSNDITVRINTTAELTSVSKGWPTRYSTWQNSWGEKPADADGYFYLLWPITTKIKENVTQPYDLDFVDTLISAQAWKLSSSGEEPQEVDMSKISVAGYILSGSKAVVDRNHLSAERTEDRHFDYVLTKLDKMYFNQFERYVINNKIDVTLTPIDGIDEPTAASAVGVFKWSQPVFVKPTGSFIMYKRGDGNYRKTHSTPLADLGMKAADYSRYDLELFKTGELEYLTDLDYAAWVNGFPTPWTIAEDDDWRDPDNFYQVPVFWTIEDDEFHLYEDGGERNDRLLDGRDYQIDKLAYRAYARKGVFDEDRQMFVDGPEEYEDVDYVVYAKFQAPEDVTDYTITVKDAPWVEVARFNKGTNERSYNSNYVKMMNEKTISFKDNCVGFKIETSTTQYFSCKIDAVPTIRLKRSDYVLQEVEDLVSVAIDNTAHVQITDVKGNDLYVDSETDADYVREVQRDSYIRKDSVSGSNMVKDRCFSITWKIQAQETYIEGTGDIKYVNQESGTFYDLIPAGMTVVPDSVVIMDGKKYLNESDYEVSVIQNYKNTGRTLLKVDILVPGDQYSMLFDTHIDWDSINDVGTEVYNPVAYQTGNKDIKDGFPDNGGNLPDGTNPKEGSGANEKALMTSLDPLNDGKARFIYADEYYDISAITAATAGLTKKIKAEKDADYVYDTFTNPNGNYSYRWRYMNDFKTEAKNMILYDSMENYVTDHESDWRGTLQNIDLSQLYTMDIEPVVYYSSIEKLDLNNETHPENHDIHNTSVWLPEETFLEDHTLADVKAIAVDMSKDKNGDAFVLGNGESVSIVVNMKAPAGAESDGTRIPESLNNIYISDTVIDEMGNEKDFYIHHDYTVIRFKVSNDLKLKKVSEENPDQVVPRIKFRLTGTSDYGTEENRIAATDLSGRIIFKDLEKGSYILSEYSTTEDWLEDHTEHYVTVDSHGRLLIDGDESEYDESFDYSGRYFVVTNKPRIHGDITFTKRQEGTPLTGDVRTILQQIRNTPLGSENLIEIDGNLYKVYDKTDDIATLQLISRTDGTTYEKITDRELENLVPSLSYNLLDVQASPYYNPVFEGEAMLGDYFYYQSGPSANNITFFNQLAKYIDLADVENLTFAKYDEYADIVTGITPIPVDNMANGTINAYLVNDTLYVLSNSLINGDEYFGRLYNFPNLKNVRYENYKSRDTSVQDISRNKTIESVEFIYYDAANVDQFTYLFRSQAKLKYVDFSGMRNFHPSMFDEVFHWCSSIETIDLSALDTSSVTNIYGLFSECPNLTTIYASEKWTTANVENQTREVFYGNYKLPNVSGDVPVARYGEGGNLTYKPYVENASLVTIDMNTRPATVIPDTKFQLTGTSEYGTEVNSIVTSNASGIVSFKDIEKGTYELKEITSNPNYVRNETVWTVVVDATGKGTVLDPEDESKRDRLYHIENVGKNQSIYNEPRYWNFDIKKLDKENNSIALQGAEFRLNGISDLGTEYDVTSISDENGNIHFENIEKGQYILQEVQAPTGVDATGKIGGNRNYITDPTQYIVTINYKGDLRIDGMSHTANGEYYAENERALDGRITIIKKWEDADPSSRETPTLILSTQDMDFVKKDITVEKIWLDSDGNPITDESLLPDASDVAAYITTNKETDAPDEFDPATMTKYAVSVYDIEKDIDENGNVMGLTFGPATGGNFNKAVTAHQPTGFTENSHPHRCIHEDNWATILEWNATDPYVYEQCIEEGCTHSVNLTLDPSVRDTSTRPSFETGDGESTFANSYYINEPTKWNDVASVYGGYGASRVRAQLNHSDALTNVVIPDGYPNAGAYPAGEAVAVNGYYDNGKSFIDAFPEYLKEAIGNKKIEYDFDPYYENEGDTRTVYDKLWLLSAEEMFSDTQNDRYRKFKDLTSLARQGVNPYSTNEFKNVYYYPIPAWLRSTGDSQYNLGKHWVSSLGEQPVNNNAGISPCFTLKRDTASIVAPKPTVTKNEVVGQTNPRRWVQKVDSSTGAITWQQTISLFTQGVRDYFVYEVSRVRDFIKDTNSSNQNSVEDDKGTITNQYTDDTRFLKYAVSLYDIGKDVNQTGDRMGLTFGPATGANYSSSYHSHEPTGVTDGGHEHRCIHNDSWDEIIRWNNTDPYVYEQCIEEGCTHTVPLDFTKHEILGTAVRNNPVSGLVKLTGDGYSNLTYELAARTDSGNEPGELFNWATPNSYQLGYGPSRIRAIMNGLDDNAEDDGITTYIDSYNYLPIEIFSGNECILTAFPKALQNNIGKRAVNYEIIENGELKTKTTFDKLWLLSVNEVYTTDAIEAATTSSNIQKNHPTEGTIYRYFQTRPNAAQKSFYGYNGRRPTGRSIEYNPNSMTVNPQVTSLDALYSGGAHTDSSAYSPCFTLDTTYDFGD